MKRLHEQMQPFDKFVIMAITGMGGVGKTELAIQYAKRHWKQDFPGGVCWLNANELDIGARIISFCKSYLELSPSEDTKLEDQIAYCWHHWPSFASDGQPPQPVLIVLDNVTNYHSIESYLPHDSRFAILLTTRIALGSRIPKIQLDVLTRDSAIKLLKQLAGSKRIEGEQDTAESLCEWVGYLPLGLELIGRYWAIKPFSLAKLQDRLYKQELQADALNWIEEGMTADLGVISAIELSWQAISSDAQELAYLLCLFALAPIPWSLVERCFPNIDDSEKLERPRDSELLRFSLLKNVSGENYQLHQLIRLFIRTKLPENLNDLKCKFCSGIAAFVKDKINYKLTEKELINVLAPSLPHLEEVIHILEIISPEIAIWEDSQFKRSHTFLKGDDFCAPFIGLGRFYTNQNVRPEEENPYVKAKEVYERLQASSLRFFGDNSYEYALSLNALGAVNCLQYEFEKAEKNFQQALDIVQYSFPEKYLDIVTGQINSTYIFCKNPDNPSGEKVRKIEASYRLIQGCIGRYQLRDDYQRLIINFTNISCCYMYCSNLEGAAIALNRAESLLEGAPASLNLPKQPYKADIYHAFADIYHKQEYYERAKAYIEDVIKMREDALGKEHVDTGRAFRTLGVVYADLAIRSFKNGFHQESTKIYCRKSMENFLSALEIFERCKAPTCLGKNIIDDMNSLQNHPYLGTL